MYPGLDHLLFALLIAPIGAVLIITPIEMLLELHARRRRWR